MKEAHLERYWQVDPTQEGEAIAMLRPMQKTARMWEDCDSHSNLAQQWCSAV